MRLELGINNCFAVKRWPQPEEWSEIISRDLGLGIVQHSLDLSLDDEPAADTAAITRACERTGLRVVTLILEVIPAFEADDARVLDELRESVAYWKQALHDRDLR